MEEITVGAVAYHPRVLTVWEAFREYFREAGHAHHRVSAQGRLRRAARAAAQQRSNLGRQ
jgi:hypothetical protein